MSRSSGNRDGVTHSKSLSVKIRKKKLFLENNGNLKELFLRWEFLSMFKYLWKGPEIKNIKVYSPFLGGGQKGSPFPECTEKEGKDSDPLHTMSFSPPVISSSAKTRVPKTKTNKQKNFRKVKRCLMET